jgi:hypothetical protein
MINDKGTVFLKKTWFILYILLKKIFEIVLMVVFFFLTSAHQIDLKIQKNQEFSTIFLEPKTNTH